VSSISALDILAASGGPGPKLEEGDRQVPEGIYRIASLNPNSAFHLSLALDYPNTFDRKMAQPDRRNRLGGDIMIHGNSVSTGCIAVGDSAIEELFTLVAQVGRPRVRVIVAPYDPVDGRLTPLANAPSWTGDLYLDIERHLAMI